jgi:hypothetical protein
MDAFGLELGGGIRTFGVPIETIKISGSRLNPLHQTIVVAPGDFFQGYHALFWRKNMDLHPVNQGGPDEESAQASSQVGSSQTAFKIHRDSLPRRSGVTIVGSDISLFC